MSRFVYYLFVKKAHFDSFTMVPVTGMEGDENFFKQKIEPFFDEHVKNNYPNTFCEIRKVPIIAECIINMNKAKTIKKYKGGTIWKKVKKVKSL